MPMLYLGCANLGQQKYRERKVSQEIIANSCWEMYNVAGHSALPSKCKLLARLGISEKSVQDMVLPWTGGREGFHLPLPISPSLHHWRLASLSFWFTWSGSCDGFYDVRFIPTEQFCFGVFFLPYSKNGRRQKLQVCDWWGSCTVAAKGSARRCRRQVVELAVGCSKWHQSATEEKLVNESPRQWWWGSLRQESAN